MIFSAKNILKKIHPNCCHYFLNLSLIRDQYSTIGNLAIYVKLVEWMFFILSSASFLFGISRGKLGKIKAFASRALSQKSWIQRSWHHWNVLSRVIYITCSNRYRDCLHVETTVLTYFMFKKWTFLVLLF
jgi:hypothetical protein